MHCACEEMWREELTWSGIESSCICSVQQKSYVDGVKNKKFMLVNIKGCWKSWKSWKPNIAFLMVIKLLDKGSIPLFEVMMFSVSLCHSRKQKLSFFINMGFIQMMCWKNTWIPMVTNNSSKISWFPIQIWWILQCLSSTQKPRFSLGEIAYYEYDFLSVHEIYLNAYLNILCSNETITKNVWQHF